MKYIARYSDHIQDDINRKWSSWNFGQQGFEGTEDQLESDKKHALDTDSPFYISGFDLWGKDIKNADIRELYPNYWVLVDNVNGHGEGIFGRPLESDNLKDAIKEAKDADYSGEGYKFNPENWKLVKSINNSIHIFQMEDEETGVSLPDKIKDQLQKLNSFYRPYVHRANELNHTDVVHELTKIVLKQKVSIQDAITQLENDLSPNSID